MSSPGAVNSIPSSVHLEIDLREVDLAHRDSVITKITDASRLVSERRHVTIHPEMLNEDAPARCASAVVAAVVQACDTHGLCF